MYSRGTLGVVKAVSYLPQVLLAQLSHRAFDQLDGHRSNQRPVASLVQVGDDVEGSAYIEVHSRVPVFDLHRSAELGNEGPVE